MLMVRRGEAELEEDRRGMVGIGAEALFASKSSTLVEVCALRQASGSFAGAAGGGVDVSAGSV